MLKWIDESLDLWYDFSMSIMYKRGDDILTQLEIVERANMYLEKLAHGINPLDGCPIAEDELLRNPRISKCLAFSAGILQDVLRNGGITPMEKLEKAPLFIPPEILRQYPFSEYPISISEIVRRINSLINVVRMEPLRYGVVSQFLEDQGLLMFAALPDGKRARRPTELGLSMGIVTAERGEGAHVYTAVQFDRRAQAYIIEHFPEIQQRSNQIPSHHHQTDEP